MQSHDITYRGTLIDAFRRASAACVATSCSSRALRNPSDACNTARYARSKAGANAVCTPRSAHASGGAVRLVGVYTVSPVNGTRSAGISTLLVHMRVFVTGSRSVSVTRPPS
jgi:hypothetical protein